MSIGQKDLERPAMTIARANGQRFLPFMEKPCYPCWFEFLEPLSFSCALPDLGRRGKRLCSKHRARSEEGACVLCGRRLAWLTFASTPEFAICRPCLVDRRGEEAAGIVESMLDSDWIKLLV
jgi:hypothetical protein